MKTISPHPSAAVRYGLVLMLACLALWGCDPALMGGIRQDPGDTGAYTGPGYADLTGTATVFRGGGRLPASRFYRLQRGDIIETGFDPGATIRFPDGNGVILDSNTRVHLSRLFVEFGRILARVEGFFEVDSENIVAGVEGTEFVFEVTRDRDVVVTALNGSVVCRSKRQSWRVPLYRGEIFYSRYPNLVNPGKRPATRKELDDLRLWVRRVEGRAAPEAPEKGYCCTPNGVFQSTRENCRGTFYLDAGQARKACQSPPREESGYCCSGGRVYAATAESCRGVRGVFASTESEAYQRCPDAQQGWCCRDGQVSQTSRSRCNGIFFTNSSEAQRNCRPKPEQGYCCLKGQVSQSTRENCRGTFYLDAGQARKACLLRSPLKGPLPTDIIRPKPYEAPVIR